MSSIMICIGVTDEARLEDLMKAHQPQLVALCDANEVKLERAYNFLSQLVQVKKFPFLITPDGGPVTFFQYNLDAFDSTLEASKLSDLYPGVNVKSTATLHSLAIGELIENLNTQNEDYAHSSHYTLVINIPGQELQLIKNLNDKDILGIFNILVITSAKETWYESGNTKYQLQEYVQNNNFKLSVEREDGDFSITTFKLDRVKIDNLKLQAEFDSLKVELSNEKLKNKELTEKLSLTQSDNVQVRDLLDQLETTNKRVESALIEKENELERIKSELRDTINSKDKLGLALEQLEQSWRDKHNLNLQTVTRLESELETAREDTRNAIRLVTIRDGDLKDLQQKYSKALEVQQRQFTLLDTMQERLEQASHYLLQLDADTATAEFLLSGESAVGKSSED